MFDDFSFDTRRSPSLDSNISSSTAESASASRPVSPCTALGPFPPPPTDYSVTDLSVDLGRSRIDSTLQPSQIYQQPCEAYANLDNDAAWSVEQYDAADMSRSQQRPMSPSRRLERQLNARLLYTSSHHRDVAALVARMVSTGEQCSVAPPTSFAETMTPSSTATSAVDDVDGEDEGYDSCSQSNSLHRSRMPSMPRQSQDYRRASDIRRTSACIRKEVRVRKDRTHRRRRTGEQA